IYKKLGQVTNILCGRKKFDYLNVLGPLGNTFTNWDNPNNIPILVGGGTGLAPLLNMHKKCLALGLKHALVLGARNSAQHFLKHNPEEGIYLCTDDGSLGIKGTVMTPLEQILKKHRNPHLFSCGPEPMLKAVQALALKNRIVCQLSVESYMACGTGLCQGCAVTKNDRDGSSSSIRRYSLVCIKGPVYKAGEVLFD
ncbi:MAG: dihydroorotate dehydrogenase electron transfer subunit, partial [Candidatus Neomarinimicrobiota bacterium]